jgi:Flp pilus assembly protein protease CpaA
VVQGTIIKIILLTWLCGCAWQDWRVGEVSNWLTLPPMAVAGLYALMAGGNTLIIFIAALIGVFIFFYLGSFGGADAKILVVLAGLWPAAFIGAILVQGGWGLMVMLQKGRTAEFRAVPAYAAGALISLLIGII